MNKKLFIFIFNILSKNIIKKFIYYYYYYYYYFKYLKKFMAQSKNIINNLFRKSWQWLGFWGR